MKIRSQIMGGINRLFAGQAGTFCTQSTGQTNRMHGSTMSILYWSICISLLLTAAPAMADGKSKKSFKSIPIVKLVREATEQYQDPEVAIANGYFPDPYCISGQVEGAAGIHYTNFALFGDGVVNAATPEILVYEPTRGGKHRLVGVEYIVFVDGPVAIEGQLMHFFENANRIGVPFPFLDLHVWAWKRNPLGTFATFNPDVSCDAQPLDP